MALINFTLRHPDHIIPWGEEGDKSIHWFGLTEGEYWLDLNKATLYEYTNEVLAAVDDQDGHYVTYQIARLLEDWASIFDAIAAPVPDAFYDIAKSNNFLYRFYGAAMNYIDKLPDAEYEAYDKTIEWIYSRTLVASHLNSGPGISFFRNKHNLSLVWKADYVTENNVPIWTAQNGELEMPYDTFVHEMEDFGHRFFQAMDNQLQLAIAKDWGTTKVNKDHLLQEQQQRKAQFQTQLASLKNTPTKLTDWEGINTLITKMFS